MTEEPEPPEAGAEGVISEVIDGSHIGDDYSGRFLVLSERGNEGAYIASDMPVGRYLPAENVD